MPLSLEAARAETLLTGYRAQRHVGELCLLLRVFEKIVWPARGTRARSARPPFRMSILKIHAFDR